MICAFNCTPVPRNDYLLGVPRAGTYAKVLDSDAAMFGGSGYAPEITTVAEPVGWQGYPARIRVQLPPLAMVVWQHVD